MSGTYIELLSYSPRASLSWSTWPPASAFSNHGSSTTTVSARQESGLRSTVNRCGLNDFTVNAPVPTAASSAVNVTGSSTSAHTCSATTSVCRYIPERENDGCSNVSTTSVPEVASAPTSPGATPRVSRAGLSRSRLNVKATSRALNGSPSFQVTPSRVVIRSSVGLVHSYPVASCGSSVQS